MKRFALILVLFAFALHGVEAQPNLNFKRVTVNWPTIDLAFSVGCNGHPSYNMAKQDFRIFENGAEVNDFTLWCPNPTIPCPLSVALVFDASGSMSGSGNVGAKAGGRAFIDKMNGVTDEATIIWFNTQVNIAQQMTTIKPLLNSAVDGLPAGGGTAVWDGCYAGIIEIINNGVNQCRGVIVMTDGGDNSSTRTPAEIISLANRNRIPVFTIGLGSSINATELEMIALLTGGRYYQTPNAGQLPAIYGEIYTIMQQGMQECVISYERDCADGGMRTVELRLENFCGGTDVKTKTYRAPLDSTTFSDLYIEIGSVSALKNNEVTVPIDLLTPIAQKQFYPLAFTLLYDTTYLQFKSAQAPGGGLLDGLPLAITPDSTGTRIAVTDRKVLNGSGRLFDVVFTTKNAPDSTVTYIEAYQPVFEQGCFTPQFTYGTVAFFDGPVITPQGALAFCEGDSVRLAAPQGYSDYQWSTGDSTRVITVRDAGDYTVSAKNPAGVTLPSAPVTVVVYPLPAPRLSISDTLHICPGSSVQLGITDGTGISAYRWSTNQITPSIVVRTAGTYYVRVTGPNGCEGYSDTLTVVSEPLDVRLSSAGNHEFCDGDSLTLDAGAYASYHWSTGDTTRMLTVRQTGRYFVSVTNAAGCAGASDTADVLVHPSPIPQIQPPGATILCEGDSVTLDAGAGFTSYNWNTGDTTRTITVSSSGAFSVSVSNAFGCIGVSEPATVTMETPPAPMIVADGPARFCEGDSVALDAGAGYATYLWSTSETTREIIVHTAGRYWVTVTSSAGCEGGSDTIDVTVDPVPAKPVVTRDLDVLSTGAAGQYQWYRHGIEIAGATQQSYTVVRSGSYVVEVTNAFGCSAFSDPFTVDVLGVEAPGQLSAFNLYPDPNDGTVNISLRTATSVTWDVTVTNLLGQRYYMYESSQPAAKIHHTIDLRTAPRGMYLLHLRAGDRNWTRRIIRR